MLTPEGGYQNTICGQTFHIRPQMMEGIQRYVKRGIRPGGFLSAVICNDLREAVGKADDENLMNLPAFVSYFYNETPSNCWGSRERMKAWLDMKVDKEREERSE